ncbi:MAG: hypothetical protein JXB05_23115 [Myxococcaceae bacterium]|nr:hypothetical protein [Myxococcaceae bacterium]
MDANITKGISIAMPGSNSANMLTLQGKNVSVTYSATSITGQPLLHYKDRSRDVSAQGMEIRQVETELGTLVSITLEPDADAGALLFTLLVPRVALMAEEGEQSVKTVGIITRSRLPPRLMASAQLQTYEVVDLRGCAAFAVS